MAVAAAAAAAAMAMVAAAVPLEPRHKELITRRTPLIKSADIAALARQVTCPTQIIIVCSRDPSNCCVKFSIFDKTEKHKVVSAKIPEVRSVRHRIGCMLPNLL